MEQKTLESLRKNLQSLPVNQAETANKCWREIQWSAERYRDAISSNESMQQTEPWKVEQEIRGIATLMKDLARRLQHASPDALRRIENEANYEPPEWALDPWHEEIQFRSEMRRMADPFPWFEIGRYLPQSDGSWEPEEPHWGEDAMRPVELAMMATYLEEVAQRVAGGKAAPNGARELRPATRAKMQAKELLISSLDFELRLMEERPKTHTLPIVQTVHRWATDEPVGEDWGKTELDRYRKWVEEGPPKEGESRP